MSIFTDVVATVSKAAWSKILMYIFLFLVIIYLSNMIGGWIKEKFTDAPTRDELIVQTTQQDAVIEQQQTALEDSKATLDMTKDLTIAAIQSMEDHNRDNVASVSKQATIAANLDKAETINKAEVIKITALEKDEAVKKQKLLEADQRLAETQNLEIEAAYKLALERSHL